MNYAVVGIVFLAIGLVFGLAWPWKSWRWGLWICAPLVILLMLSVAFAGNVTAFLKYDLSIVLISLPAACLGSFIGAWLRKRRIQA